MTDLSRESGGARENIVPRGLHAPPGEPRSAQPSTEWMERPAGIAPSHT